MQGWANVNSRMTEAHPPIASREEWLAARTALLAEEKAHTDEYDRINAKRRRMPMVKVRSDYVFQGPDGEKTLLELFEDKKQLVVYHFMFAPEWEKGCSGCTSFVDALGDLSELGDRDTRMVLVSRAPHEKLRAYEELRGWDMPWYSSGESDFNYDFHVTLDPSRGPLEYNYRPVDDLSEVDERPGLSVFFRIGDEVFHTYSAFARGVESLTDSYRILDVTPFGRQEDFEDSPEGWPQRPTYG